MQISSLLSVTFIKKPLHGGTHCHRISSATYVSSFKNNLYIVHCVQIHCKYVVCIALSCMHVLHVLHVRTVEPVYNGHLGPEIFGLCTEVAAQLNIQSKAATRNMLVLAPI